MKVQMQCRGELSLHICYCVCIHKLVLVLHSGTLVRHGGPSKAGAATPTDEEVDPRLKNFEPRMVELIISEVIK